MNLAKIENVVGVTSKIHVGLFVVAPLGETGLFTFTKAFPHDSGRPLPLFPWPVEMERT